MALQGTLKDFSITEIIQLIGQQLKTGVLKIQRGKNVVEISFVDGMIVHVFSNYRGKQDLIGEILVKAQLITQEQLERVLRIQKETFKYLGEILVELQLLSKEDVLKVISTQIYETIYDLFWWEDGDFYFDLKLVESYRKVPFALSTEQVLLSILRMVDEWSEIEKRVSSPHLVFKKSARLEEKSLGVVSSQDYLKERLTSEQELIYNLIDGNRTVQEMIDRSLLGKFNASEILSDLMEMGLIEVAGIHTPSFVKKVRRFNLNEIPVVVYYGASLAVVLFLLFSFKPELLSFLMNSKIGRVDVEAPTRFVQKVELDRIRNALDIYYVEKGNYPGRLEDLVSERLLRKSDLFYQKGASYQYQSKDGKYFLKH